MRRQEVVDRWLTGHGMPPSGKLITPLGERCIAALSVIVGKNVPADISFSIVTEALLLTIGSMFAFYEAASPGATAAEERLEDFIGDLRELMSTAPRTMEEIERLEAPKEEGT